MKLKDIKDDLIPVIKRLPTYGKLSFFLFKDHRLNRFQKLMLIAGLGYTISPVDLVPGFIPVVGQLDDLYVMLTLLHKVLKSLPPNVTKEHLQEVELRIENIEDDIKAVKKASGKIAVSSVKFLGRSIWFITKTAFKIGRSMIIRNKG
ncbi:MAG: hypothetical protein COS84_11745 [Armatimonadetes bacterium CG07_land_8_20_14_0_80_40_9]|nr:MAG: hypothetical protein COS84_11745 [Armatimonadetes bacterium CG07_land_8_20_14_0_80_40_9]